MGILKRFEIWVLLVLVAVGLFFVLRDPGGFDDDSGGGSGDGKKARFSVEKVELTRDFSNFEASIHIDYDNRDGGEVNTALAKLHGKGSRQIPTFFLAIEPPPILPAGKRSEAVVRFWLDLEDLDGPLWLEILGEKVAVKSDAVFNGKAIENQSARTIRSLEWK